MFNSSKNSPIGKDELLAKGEAWVLVQSVCKGQQGEFMASTLFKTL